MPLGVRNSSVTQQADAQATFNGITVSGSTSISLFDCGSVGVGDLFLLKPVERHATVQGTVTDDAGAPVPGVFVSTSANVATAQTDADGHYLIPNFRFAVGGGPTQSTRVAFVPPSPPGTHWPTFVNTTLTDNQTVTVDAVLLRKHHGAITGTVTDAVTGQPIAGANITGPPNARAQSDGAGSYTLDNVDLMPQNQPIDTSVVASLNDYWGSTVNAHVTADNTTTANLTLLRKCAPVSVTGTIFNAATHAPLEGVTVSGFGNGATTDANGHFSMDGLQPVNNQPFGVTIGAFKPGFFTAQRSVTVFCGAHLVVDFGDEATGTGSVHGKVTKKADGSPLGGLLVGGDWGSVTTTAPDGTYAFANVPLGGEPAAGWGVHVTAPPLSGLGDATQNAIVTAAKDTALDFQLDAPHRPQADRGRAALRRRARHVPGPGDAHRIRSRPRSDHVPHLRHHRRRRLRGRRERPGPVPARLQLRGGPLLRGRVRRHARLRSRRDHLHPRGWRRDDHHDDNHDDHYDDDHEHHEYDDDVRAVGDHDDHGARDHVDDGAHEHVDDNGDNVDHRGEDHHDHGPGDHHEHEHDHDNDHGAEHHDVDVDEHDDDVGRADEHDGPRVVVDNHHVVAVDHDDRVDGCRAGFDHDDGHRLGPVVNGRRAAVDARAELRRAAVHRRRGARHSRDRAPVSPRRGTAAGSAPAVISRRASR